MHSFLFRIFSAALLFVVSAHAQQSSTWDVIQQDILNHNCVTCHSTGTSFARQSGLVLSQDVAYENLVDVPSKNTAATDRGLLRVSSAGGFRGIAESFFWEKINAPNEEHFYNDHPGYGQIMPLGLPFLTNGQLEFVSQWIKAGAPKTDSVASLALLADTSRYEPPAFKVLSPPEKGFQFHMGPFDVWPAQVHDREFLYFEPFETSEDLFISRYEISMRPGSHHFIVYNYPEGKAKPPARTFRDVRDAQGKTDILVLLQLIELFPFSYFAGTQTPYANFHFPKDMALRLPKGSGFDLNSHSVNRTAETQIGEAYINFFTVDRSEIKRVIEYDNFGNDSFNLPPHEVTTVEASFTFKETRHLVQLTSHAHEKMVEFSIYGVGGQHDGELLYWTNDWEHPPILELDPPLTMQQGEGVRFVTIYDNPTDQAVSFGQLSSDEMQFMFYLYYTGDVLTDVTEEHTTPTEFELEQNYPNPFNPGTQIRYSLAKNSVVTLKVYDLAGREVQTLVNQFQLAGTHSQLFDGSGLTSGVYFLSIAGWRYQY